MHPAAECLAGSLATCVACLFTNPLETIKTRMQLQGELQSRGTYKIYYRNVFHAFYTIAKVDGILALQSGLVPALCYQFVMNGIRLGSYQIMVNAKLTEDREGKISYLRCMAAGALSGCTGAAVCSPIFMIKTQLQSKSSSAIAVGTQHDITNLSSGIISIYREHGVRGLWRGASASMVRVTVGSATQLSAFSKSKDFYSRNNIFEPGSFMLSVSSSMTASVFVVLAMTPFDVISTRLYNQNVNSSGIGLKYTNFFDVFVKVFAKEGFLGFYKGTFAHYFRLGPHTIIGLVLWDSIRKYFG
ncbi:solute carrier family 25 member 35 isoform X1 [Hydra vulgaris]|uniref:solute carrier family 25 member 35 isoform X1 n=1 Tax=Hydra vulgaris TaxID=6087 RepID=UPI001F5EB543|nr:solute carrier family 25 member 35 isoform X1 [Hydra vulgaris]